MILVSFCFTFLTGNKNSKIRLNDDSCEVQKLLDDEASQFFVSSSKMFVFELKMLFLNTQKLNCNLNVKSIRSIRVLQN